MNLKLLQDGRHGLIFDLVLFFLMYKGTFVRIRVNQKMKIHWGELGGGSKKEGAVKQKAEDKVLRLLYVFELGTCSAFY